MLAIKLNGFQNAGNHLQHTSKRRIPALLVCRTKKDADIGRVVIALSRKRSSDPAKPCTFSMPSSLHTRLNNHLSFEMSRSAWITTAIESKLNGDKTNDSLDHWTTDEILQELLYSDRLKSNAAALEIVRTLRLLL